MISADLLEGIRYIIDTEWFGELFSCYGKRHIRVGGDCPFYQSQTAMGDFDASDAAWVYAASAVAVRRARIADHGAVGVTGDQDAVLVRGPVCEVLFDATLFRIISGSTCGI